MCIIQNTHKHTHKHHHEHIVLSVAKPIQHSRAFGGCSTVIMRTQCCYQLCFQQFTVLLIQCQLLHAATGNKHMVTQSLLGSVAWGVRAKRGGTKCKRKWQGKEEGAWWDGEEVQAVVLSMEGIGQARVIGGFCTVLRWHIPFPRQP